MIYLFDKAKTLLTAIEPQQITEHQQEITLNGLITAAAATRYIPEIEQAQFFGAKDIDDEGIFWLYKIDRLAKTDGMALLDGTYILFDDLAGRGIMKDRRPTNEGAATVLADILEGTGWQVGIVNTAHTGTSNYYYVSKLTAFWDFLKKWRVEFKPRIAMTGSTITGRYIDIADRLSQDYGKWYEYGSNLLTITAERAAVPYTAFVGRGKGEEVGDGYGRRITFEGVEWATPTNPVNKPMDQAWVDIPEATAAYGYEDGSPRIGIVEFPEITDPVALLQATYEHALANARPAVQFSSNVVETGAAEAGETVTVLRPDSGIRYKTRIFKYKRNFLTGKVRSVEFGDQLQATTAQRAAELTAEAKAREVESLSLLQTLRNAITQAYFNEDGYNYDLPAGNAYELPGGYYSFDAPITEAPTKAIYMGGGKLLISNSKDPTGQWVWRTAADGNGLVADAITTGILNANLITAGILKGGKVNWNLETGVFYIGDSLATADISWDGANLYVNGAEIDISSNATITALDSRLDSAELKITPSAITSTVTSSATYTTDLAGKEQSIIKQSTAPDHLAGKLWLDTSVTPNILKRSTGTEWVNASYTSDGIVAVVRNNANYTADLAAAAASRDTKLLKALMEPVKAGHTDLISRMTDLPTDDTTLNTAASEELTAYNILQTTFDTVIGNGVIDAAEWASFDDALAAYQIKEASLATAISKATFRITGTLAYRLTTAEEKITADSIINTITSSEEWQQSLSEKLSTSDLAAGVDNILVNKAYVSKSTVDGQIETLTSSITAAGESIKDIQTTFVKDIDGISIISGLGSTMELGASSIRFLMAGQDTWYWDKGVLYTKDVEVLGSIVVGNHKIEKNGTAGTIFVPIGGV